MKLLWLLVVSALVAAVATLVQRWRRTSHTQIHRITATHPRR